MLKLIIKLIVGAVVLVVPGGIPAALLCKFLYDRFSKRVR